jgi:hypothetical protein
MKMAGPIRYRMKFDTKSFSVECPQGTAKFSGFATSSKPKLYIASVDDAGATGTPIRFRLRVKHNTWFHSHRRDKQRTGVRFSRLLM